MTGRGKSARGGGGRARNPTKRSLDNSKEQFIDEDEEQQLPVKKSNRTTAGETAAAKRAKQQQQQQQLKRQQEELDDEDDDELGDEEEEEDDELDDDEDDASDSDHSNSDQPPREFGPRSFVVLKADFDKGIDPPLWRIDGSSLLQKYTPFKDPDGTMLYKSTSVYSGWSINNKESYYPAIVTFKRQEKNDTVIHFDRSQIKAEKSK